MSDPIPGPAGREFIPLSICELTVSDTRTEDTDKSGRLPADRLIAAGHTLHEKRIVPDDVYRIRAVPCRNGSRLPESRTPSSAPAAPGSPAATARRRRSACILDKIIDGFGEVFRAISYEEIRTSTMQSRALAGVDNAT